MNRGSELARATDLLRKAEDTYRDDIFEIMDNTHPDGKNTFTFGREEPVRFVLNVKKGGRPERHKKLSDLWLAFAGNTKFTYRGTLVNELEDPNNPDESTGDSISGGDEHVVKEGGLFVVRHNVVHGHEPEVKGETSGLLIVKFTLPAQIAA